MPACQLSYFQPLPDFEPITAPPAYLTPAPRRPRQPYQSTKRPVQLILRLYDALTVRQMYLQHLRNMRIDDALIWLDWRLEFVYLASGFRHFRLYRGKQLVGIEDVISLEDVTEIKRDLASYLVWLGAEPERVAFVPGGAYGRRYTPESKWGKPHLCAGLP